MYSIDLINIPEMNINNEDDDYLTKNYNTDSLNNIDSLENLTNSSSNKQ